MLYVNETVKKKKKVCPEETRIERDTCTPVFTAALLTIARTWWQPRCTPADEWIRKLWYITHQSEWLLSKSLQAINAREGVEKSEPPYAVGGNAS